MNRKNIMIVGVGGQGTLLASKLIGNALLSMDFDVKVSEVHGMSQRGGSVVTYVKFGEKIHSPIITEGEADYIIAFEQLEAARWLPNLKADGTIIVNEQRIDPMPVITGSEEYPEGIIEKLKKEVNVINLDALALAKQADNAKAVNVVLTGVLAKLLGFPKEIWLNSIKQTVPEKFLQQNITAFELGWEKIDVLSA